MRDITAELAERMANVQERLEGIKQQREVLDASERDLEQKLQALRVALDWERGLHGESVSSGVENGHNRWLGLSLRDAVGLLRLENPRWGHADIRDRLISDGFDFKGKKPGNAVNMVLQRDRKGTSATVSQ